MIKKLCIICLSAFLTVSLVAQSGNRSSEVFKPKCGDWQVSLQLGSGKFFTEYDGINYLLPKYNNSGGSTIGDLGLPGGSTGNQSGDPGLYLDLGASFNSNSIVNIASIQGAYFLTDRIQVNLAFSMDLNITPKKNYVESFWDPKDDPTSLPNYQYVEGRISNKWMVAAGGNYYFRTNNNRINLYTGAVLGYQRAGVTTLSPYTGEVTPGSSTDPNEPVEIFRPNRRLGMVHGIRGAAVAGIEISLMEGLVFGFEVDALSYNYTLLRMTARGMGSFSTAHHNLRAITYPSVKLGIRF